MIVLSTRELTRQFDADPVLNEVGFEIRQGERIGLVGPNGAGKTTLLNILCGEDEADSGEVEKPKRCLIGKLEQRPEFLPTQTVRQIVEQGLSEIFELQAEAERLAAAFADIGDAAESERLHKRYDQVHADLERLNGFEVGHRVEEVLLGLGFTPDFHDRPATSLSGGQQNRLLLGQLLLQAPDLMLLDEPTNHLDIDAITWLEDFLVRTNQTTIVVSHDRYFLDRVVTRIFELARGNLNDYPGNFTQYRRLRAERIELLAKTRDKQLDEIARAEDFIRRNKVGQLATRAKDREKKLARIELVEIPGEIVGPPMRFPEPSRTGDWVFDTVDVSQSYDGHPPLFSDFTLRIERGERIGVFGPNGAGKTTLLKTLVGDLPTKTGKVRIGSNVQIAYFDQQLQSVDPTLTAVDAVRPEDVTRFTDGQLRELLARFGVTGELALRTVGLMSGGERAKVAFAKLAATNANVLILDEPTNHLDLWALESLETALRNFAGTILFVSHDRYFLDQAATKMLVMEAGQYRVFEGNYTDYIELSQRLSTTEVPPPSPVEDQRERNIPQPKPERRKRKFPYRKVEDIEADIAEAESAVEARQQRMGDPEVHRDPEQLKAAVADYEAAKESLAQLYAHWEEAMELNS